MKRGIQLLIGAIVIIAGLALYSSMFTVNMRQQALVIQLGNPKRVISDPGLHFKTPFVQSVVYLDLVVFADIPQFALPTSVRILCAVSSHGAGTPRNAVSSRPFTVVA